MGAHDGYPSIFRACNPNIGVPRRFAKSRCGTPIFGLHALRGLSNCHQASPFQATLCRPCAPITFMLANTMKIIALLMFTHLLFSAEIIRIELRDAQGLFGGQDIVLRKDNALLTTSVARGQSIYRDGIVNFDEIVQGLDLSRLDRYTEKIRNGVPDENKPTINIYYNTGAMK